MFRPAGGAEGAPADYALKFFDCEAYRAARYRGELIIDRLASRRRFENWGAWAKGVIWAVTNTSFYSQVSSVSRPGWAR